MFDEGGILFCGLFALLLFPGLKLFVVGVLIKVVYLIMLYILIDNLLEFIKIIEF